VACLMAAPAKAGLDFHVSIGVPIPLPHVVVGLSAPVVCVPTAVVAPPRIVVSKPAVVSPPRVVILRPPLFVSPPIVVAQPHRGWQWHRDEHRWDRGWRR
jgi:hypothetical protein